MGIVLTDYVIESVIRDGLKDLRDRPALLDDLFSSLLQPHLATNYGQEVLNQIKLYVVEKKISVVQSYLLAQAKLPCYSINLGEAVESEKEANLQDHDHFDTTPITPDVIIAPFMANSYDSVTGIVSVPDSVDTAFIKPNNILIDAQERPYPIVGGVVSTVGFKQFNIGVGLANPPDLTDLVTIIANVSVDLIEWKVVPLREKIEIGIYAPNNPDVCKWMYYILMYFLHHRKVSLEQRDVQLSATQASDFGRMDELVGENVYCRFVTMTCLTYFTWKQDTTKVIGTAGINVLVPKDQIVTNDPTRTVNTES